jgi:hypothetical protein
MTPLPSVHYASLGDAVFYVQSSDAGAVVTSVEALPEDAGEGSSDGWEPPVPGTFPLMLTVVERPQAPVCVGEPVGRQWLKVMAIDTAFGVPYPYSTYSVTGRLMDRRPAFGGPMAVIPARAVWGDGREEVRGRRIADGRARAGDLAFEVQHCLYGTWQDDERVVRITPPFSDSITAE